MFFEYLAEEDIVWFICDACDYPEQEQILMGEYPCPRCGVGHMIMADKF